MKKNYSFHVFKQLEKELDLKLKQEYNEDIKYISTTSFCMECTYTGCNKIIVSFYIFIQKQLRYFRRFFY